jgi:tripartite-type tricarboxylate transporter receptor subunit TctC
MQEAENVVDSLLKARGVAVTYRCAVAHVLFLLALVSSFRPSLAEDYPTRPVHIIVPFAAGGPADVYARVVGQYLSETLPALLR